MVTREQVISPAKVLDLPPHFLPVQIRTHSACPEQEFSKTMKTTLGFVIAAIFWAGTLLGQEKQ
ncbi:MAG: hypothetical protein CMM00_12575 [Rhodopirellula sp.]|nr:hypothetical protein [Rhodopirellula sp.]